jgi:hypothetical protein
MRFWALCLKLEISYNRVIIIFLKDFGFFQRVFFKSIYIYFYFFIFLFKFFIIKPFFMNSST